MEIVDRNTGEVMNDQQYAEAVEAAETTAFEFASEKAGEYLDEIGKTDLAEMSAQEWRTLIDVVQKNWQQKYNEITPCPF